MNNLHIDIAYPLKLIWRIWHSLLLRKRDIHISPLARWNRQTQLDGHNKISAKTVIGHSHIGRYTYIQADCYLPFCEIGSFCSIAPHVRIIAYRHPTRTFVSTSPVFFSTLRQCGRTFVKENRFEEQVLADGKSAIIGHDVWLGQEARLIEGIRIGNGAIVAAGALVTKDVPPYAIVGGVPAKVIRYRFSDEQIKYLEALKWWEKDDAWLEKHVDAFADIEQLMKEEPL